MSKVDTRPDITKELLQEYVKKGYSQERISIEVNATQTMISYKMRKYGIKPAKTRASRYDEKALIKQLRNGWTTEQIAAYFNVCTATVTNWIRKNNLEKYRNVPLKKFDTKICRTCIYGAREKTISNKCNYLLITGHSRNKGQPEGDQCSKYVKGGRIRGR